MCAPVQTVSPVSRCTLTGALLPSWFLGRGKPVPSGPKLSVVVGIDPSATCTGLVALNALTGEMLSHARIRPKSTGVTRLGIIQEDLKAWLLATRAQGPIVHVCLEGYAFAAGRPGAGSQSHKLGEVGGAIKLVLYDNLGTPERYPSIPVIQQLKKFSTGKGNSPKDQVSKAVFKKWGVDLPTNDEADAYVLAQIARAIHTDTTAAKYEKEVIEAMKVSGSVHAEMPELLRYVLAGAE